jgi:hypothetical protein
MGFFNKKEDVLDLELTAYGKYLLSQGRLNPTYYAFFDDDVLYDLKAAGSEEFQNDSERRIKYNTPGLRTQPNRTGAETRTNEFLQNVTTTLAASTVADNSVAFVDAFNMAPNPFEAQSTESYIGPIGTSDLKTQYAPAWHINMLHGEITSSLDYKTANLTASNPGLAHGYVQNIPQLNIELDYRTFFSTEEEVGFLQGGGVAVDPVTGISVDYTKLTQALNSDSICLYVAEDYLLIDVEEINGIFGKENFYMEVFVTGAASTPGNTLQPLSFTGDTSLLEELGDDTVEYHLNISVDKEIPGQIQESHGIKRYIGQGGSARLRLGRDLYGSTPNEEPCE